MGYGQGGSASTAIAQHPPLTLWRRYLRTITPRRHSLTAQHGPAASPQFPYAHLPAAPPHEARRAGPSCAVRPPGVRAGPGAVPRQELSARCLAPLQEPRRSACGTLPPLGAALSALRRPRSSRRSAPAVKTKRCARSSTAVLAAPPRTAPGGPSGARFLLAVSGSPAAPGCGPTVCFPHSEGRKIPLLPSAPEVGRARRSGVRLQWSCGGVGRGDSGRGGMRRYRCERAALRSFLCLQPAVDSALQPSSNGAANGPHSLPPSAAPAVPEQPPAEQRSPAAAAAPRPAPLRSPPPAPPAAAPLAVCPAGCRRGPSPAAAPGAAAGRGAWRGPAVPLRRRR